MAMPVDLISQGCLLALAPFVGSFLGVLIRRLPEERPVIVARSECEICRHRLGWRDLVPIWSWLAAGGRCRHCGGAIGLFYPLVEMAAFAIALWSVLMLPGWIAWGGAGLGWALLALAWIDQEHGFLPDAITLPLGVAGLGMAWSIDSGALPDHVIGAVAGFAFFTAVAWLYQALRGRQGLGGGDAKLLGALGAWVGWQGLPTVVIYAALAGLALFVVPALFGRRLVLDQRLPFGPHLCIGGWLVWLYGSLI